MHGLFTQEQEGAEDRLRADAGLSCANGGGNGAIELLASRQPGKETGLAVSYDTAAALVRLHPGAVKAYGVMDAGAGEADWLQVEIALALYGFAGIYLDPHDIEAAVGPQQALALVVRASDLCARHQKTLRVAPCAGLS